LPARSPKSYFLLLTGLAALALLGWFLLFQSPGSSDQAQIQKLLRLRNAALQSGNGANFDTLVYYAGMMERTAAFSVARLVTARAAFLRAVAARWGSPVAVIMGRKLPLLPELDDKKIASCRLEGHGNRILARITTSHSLEILKTVDGWKLNPFNDPLPVVMARFEGAASSLDTVRAQVLQGRLSNPEAVLKLLRQSIPGDASPETGGL
jgi:hypothetical protein